jgi:hypothetical protein
MAQRYFITAESTYEDLRQALNTALGYPNALGKSVFQTALQAPRDSFRRVLLAVDTDLTGYATISAAIAPLLESDAMEELDEATYLSAVASATSGVSSWDDLTGKPSTFTPAAHNQAWSTITSTPTTLSGYGITDAVGSSDARLSDARTPTAHAASHATGGTDALSPADIGAATASHSHEIADVTGLQTALDGTASASHEHGASAITSGTMDVARLPVGTGSTQVAAGDHTHTQLHDRSHAITSTSDHTATAWRVFYSNGSGNVTELALGASGTVLQSNGASAAPSFATVSGGGGGSTSASDLTSGTLANARLSSRVRAAMNTYLWSSFR